MKYEKPEVVAENKEEGSFAAGCGVNTSSYSQYECYDCERTR